MMTNNKRIVALVKAVPHQSKQFLLGVNNPGQIRLVHKPWGSEEWLVHQKTPFVLKIINIKASKRTSLQYHLKKEEANFVLSGSGVLHFRSSKGSQTCTQTLVAGDLVHIKAGSIHRIEAIKTLKLIEVSTPEVDDVIRLEDDYGRLGGRGRVRLSLKTEKRRRSR